MSKRLYVKKAAYLLTCNCQNKFPFFEEDIFCNILVDNIAKCKTIKPFELIGYKINPDHTHLILQPTGNYNYSQIMHNIERTTSNHINQLINHNRPDNIYTPLKWTARLRQYNKMFVRKFNHIGFHEFPRFNWQSGFDARIIRDAEHLRDRINYLKKQAEKHNLKENKFLYVAKELPNDLVFIGRRNSE